MTEHYEHGGWIGMVSPEDVNGPVMGPWCAADGCPAAICGGPHREVETSLGIELLRDDQEPIGKPIER